MYSIIYSENCLKQLKKLNKFLKQRIISTIERLKIRPYSKIKRLAGTSFFRLRVGNYRVILDIKNKKLEIHAIEVGPRKKIYKKLFKNKQ